MREQQKQENEKVRDSGKEERTRRRSKKTRKEDEDEARTRTRNEELERGEKMKQEKKKEEKKRRKRREEEERKEERRREEEDRKRAHELELARLRASQGELIGRVDNSGGAKRPRLPAFMDGKDDLDSYLERFERFAKTSKWPEVEWATNLSALLSGHALEIYSRMGEEEAVDYKQVKQALLRGYDFTEQGFQQKFRSSKQEKGESPLQYLVRIQNYLSRWLELAGQKEDYDGLLYLILKEQFFNSCSKDLAIYLQRQEDQSLPSLAEAALRFLQTQDRKFTLKPRFQSVSANVSSTSQENRGAAFSLKCFKCGKQGHKANSCSVQMVPDRSHPNRRGAEDSRNQRRYNNRSVMSASVALQSNQNEANVNQNQQLHHRTVNDATQEEIVVVACAFTDSTHRNFENTPVTVGKVCQKEVSVLRDTGCTGVVVKKDFVSNDQFTGQCGSLRCIHGHVERVPKADIEVSTPYFSGTVSALCIPNPPHDLIIGNIEGARAADDPDPEWQHSCAVTKSAQAKKEESSAPVNVKNHGRSQNFKRPGVNGGRPVRQGLGGNYDHFNNYRSRRGDRMCRGDKDYGYDHGRNRWWRDSNYGGRCGSGGSRYDRRQYHGSGGVSHKFGTVSRVCQKTAMVEAVTPHGTDTVQCASRDLMRIQRHLWDRSAS